MRDDGYFDEQIAASYDDDPAAFDPQVVDATVDILCDLAGRGRALDFEVGTGRIALPLSQSGVQAHGIDLSKAMVAKLREKPGGAEIGLTIGDFATASVSGSFSVVYFVFNTIHNLVTQAAQVACFRNAAAHLAPGGCFVIEVGVPALQCLPLGETLRAFRLDDAHWGIDEYDVTTLAFTSHHAKLVDGKTVRWSIPFRYVWPAEFDLMAELAGMSIRERWGGWRREPFTSVSTSHVSVWEKPAS
jgi:SAM-dependent methyltransferase